MTQVRNRKLVYYQYLPLVGPGFKALVLLDVGDPGKFGFVYDGHYEPLLFKFCFKIVLEEKLQ